MEDELDNTLLLTLTELGRTLNQNSGYGTKHGYGTAILMAGVLLKKAQMHADWHGLETKGLFDGRDLNATIDARAVYCSAMAACFDVDFDYLRKRVFWGAALLDLTETLFKVWHSYIELRKFVWLSGPLMDEHLPCNGSVRSGSVEY